MHWNWLYKNKYGANLSKSDSTIDFFNVALISVLVCSCKSLWGRESIEEDSYLCMGPANNETSGRLEQFFLHFNHLFLDICRFFILVCKLLNVNVFWIDQMFLYDFGPQLALWIKLMCEHWVIYSVDIWYNAFFYIQNSVLTIPCFTQQIILETAKLSL